MKTASANERPAAEMAATPPPPLASTGEVPRETITARAAKDAVIFLKVEARIDDSFRSLV
jgi:hypothetical protein